MRAARWRNERRGGGTSGEAAERKARRRRGSGRGQLIKISYIQGRKSFIMSEEYPLATPTSDERTMGILSHILAIVPGIGILGPLLIWLIKKDGSQFVEANAKESLNFQLTVIIAWMISGILWFMIIGMMLAGIVGILDLVLVIVATVKASENKIYRYPVNLRLIK
jgi:uncharacterized Tic20 family protein